MLVGHLEFRHQEYDSVECGTEINILTINISKTQQEGYDIQWKYESYWSGDGSYAIVSFLYTGSCTVPDSATITQIPHVSYIDCRRFGREQAPPNHLHSGQYFQDKIEDVISVIANDEMKTSHEVMLLDVLDDIVWQYVV